MERGASSPVGFYVEVLISLHFPTHSFQKTSWWEQIAATPQRRAGRPSLHRSSLLVPRGSRPAHSYLRLSTGSSCAARVAGRVPKIMPTSEETTIAMIAERPEIGMR